MSAKEIEVACPCCESRLTVDVLTRTVVRSSSPQQTDEFGKIKLDESRWDSAAGKVKERDQGAGDRLDNALARERDRVDRLDDLFDRARKKLDEGDEEGAS